MAIPTDEDIEKIITAATGTQMELPILLAIWLGLRVSEIRGITWECILGGVLHIQQAIVDSENGPEIKGTKTYSGNRKLRLPQYLADLIAAQPKTNDYVVHLSGQAMYKRFSRLCEKEGLPHYRFHDGCIKIGLNQKQPHSKGGTDLVLFLFYNHKGGNKEGIWLK